jgi:hypothetical protein
LVTDNKSQSQIVFSDRTLMTFDKSTVFNVTKYEYHPEVKSGSVGTFVTNLLIGTYRTVTGAIPKANSSDYQVNTDVAVMGVAGTDYSASFRACRVDMKRNEGTPILKNAKGTLVLTSQSPYGSVKGPDLPPIKLSTPPDVFKTNLPIVRANFIAIRTMPPLDSGGAGGVCSPGSAGGGFKIKFR